VPASLIRPFGAPSPAGRRTGSPPALRERVGVRVPAIPDLLPWRQIASVGFPHPPLRGTFSRREKDWEPPRPPGEGRGEGTCHNRICFRGGRQLVPASLIRPFGAPSPAGRRTGSPLALRERVGVREPAIADLLPCRQIGSAGFPHPPLRGTFSRGEKVRGCYLPLRRWLKAAGRAGLLAAAAG
jgi:hypothetical protein